MPGEGSVSPTAGPSSSGAAAPVAQNVPDPIIPVVSICKPSFVIPVSLCRARNSLNDRRQRLSKLCQISD